VKEGSYSTSSEYIRQSHPGGRTLLGARPRSDSPKFPAAECEVTARAVIRTPWLAGMRMFRVSTFENHLVFYRSLSGTLEIMRLLQGARNIEDALDDQHCVASEVGRAFQLAKPTFQWA
jgi:hypothetical protein